MVSGAIVGRVVSSLVRNRLGYRRLFGLNSMLEGRKGGKVWVPLVLVVVRLQRTRCRIKCEDVNVERCRNHQLYPNPRIKSTPLSFMGTIQCIDRGERGGVYVGLFPDRCVCGCFMLFALNF